MTTGIGQRINTVLRCPARLDGRWRCHLPKHHKELHETGTLRWCTPSQRVPLQHRRNR